jgi:hypothetical protein
MEFLAVLGAIFLFLICKFLWDEKITSSKPATAPVLSDYEISQRNRIKSQQLLAIRLGCVKEAVWTVYKKNANELLKEFNGDAALQLMAVKQMHDELISDSVLEADALGFKRTDTPSYLALECLQEIRVKVEKEINDTLAKNGMYYIFLPENGLPEWALNRYITITVISNDIGCSRDNVQEKFLHDVEQHLCAISDDRYVHLALLGNMQAAHAELKGPQASQAMEEIGRRMREEDTPAALFENWTAGMANNIRKTIREAEDEFIL